MPRRLFQFARFHGLKTEAMVKKAVKRPASLMETENVANGAVKGRNCWIAYVGFSRNRVLPGLPRRNGLTRQTPGRPQHAGHLYFSSGQGWQIRSQCAAQA